MADWRLEIAAGSITHLPKHRLQQTIREEALVLVSQKVSYLWNLRYFVLSVTCLGFPDGSVVKNLPANAGDVGVSGLIPESGRSPGGANGNPFQYSCLENPTDRGAQWTIVHGAAKSQIQLSTYAGNILVNLTHLWPLDKHTLSFGLSPRC